MATCCFKRCSSSDDEKYCSATFGQHQSEENNNDLEDDGKYSSFIKQPEKLDYRIHANPPSGCYRPQLARQTSDVAQPKTRTLKSQQQLTVSNKISLDALDIQAAAQIGYHNIQTQQTSTVNTKREQYPTSQPAAVIPTASSSDSRYKTMDLLKKSRFKSKPKFNTFDGTSIDWKRRPGISEQYSSHIPSPTATSDRHRASYEKPSVTTHGSDANNYDTLDTYDRLGAIDGLYESINSRSTTSYEIIPERYSGTYDSIKTVNTVDSYLTPYGYLVLVDVYDDTQTVRQAAETTFADEASRDDGEIRNHFNTWSGNEEHVKLTFVQQQPKQLQVGQTWSPHTNSTIISSSTSTQF